LIEREQALFVFTTAGVSAKVCSMHAITEIKSNTSIKRQHVILLCGVKGCKR